MLVLLKTHYISVLMILCLLRSNCWHFSVIYGYRNLKAQMLSEPHARQMHSSIKTKCV